MEHMYSGSFKDLHLIKYLHYHRGGMVTAYSVYFSGSFNGKVGLE